MINSITPEQESQVEVYLKKWLDVGYRTTTTDPVLAEAAVKFLYEQILDLKTPEIHYVKSPMEAQLLCNKLVNGILPGGSEPLEYFEVARGNWWLSYYSFNDYLLNVIFPEKIGEFTKFTEFLEHSKNFHLLWTFDTFAVVCDFPSAINIDEESKLHSNFTGALVYRDGYSIYSQNGNVMDKKDWLEITKKYHSSLATEVFKKV
jgi:hypothetical protein